MRVSAPVVLVVLLAACGRPFVAPSDGGTESDGISTLTSTSTMGTSITSASNSGSSDGSDESGPGLDLPCSVEIPLGPPYTKPDVMFVVDMSSSMRDGWDHDQDPMTPMVTRWSTARALFEQVIEDFDSFPLGFQRAPSVAACAAATVDDPMCVDADVCLVEPTPEIELGKYQGDVILAALPDASASPLEIVGGSPIRAAYVSARDHLLELSEGTIDLIVLITDGGANCSEPSLPDAVESFDDELVSIVAEGFELYGIRTLVVGVGVAEQPTLPAQPDSPAVDTHAALNDLGMAGGQPWSAGMQPRKYFDAATPSELELALVDAGCAATDCTFDLTMTQEGPPPPILISYVGVENADGLEVPEVADCETENGWVWVSEGLIVSLCGSYCDAHMTCEDFFTLYYPVCVGE